MSISKGESPGLVRKDPVDAVAPGTRIRFNDTLKQDAWGAVKTAAEILAIAASMTQNVPYLGIVSSVLTELLKIQNEVDLYKSDWNEVMSIARQIKGIIDRVLEQCESRADGGALPPVLKEPLDELERCLIKTLETLNSCQTRRTQGERAASMAKLLKARTREYIDRAGLSIRVKQCRADMHAALGLFNTRLQIDQTFTMHAMAMALEDIRDKHIPLAATSIPPQPLVLPAGSRNDGRSTVPASLPAAPSIFYGRTREANHIVDLVLDKHPARIAILGSGGIGKTTIALSVLNSRQIENTFGDRRFFLSCEAVVTADGIIQGLLKLFGLTVDHKAGVSPQDLLVSHLAALGDCILCLDNLETPWDADVQAVEALLSKVAGISDLALLITTRGADRPPRIAWTRPLLPSVVPLTLEAAIEIWDAICDSHDQHSIMLIRAVDQVPLAVTLLAHLAQSESTDSLWARWEDEQIELLRARGPGSRLTQVDISIQISLHSPRLRDEPLTLQLFSVICTLPQGLPESRIPAFVATFRDQLPHLRRSITLLKQCSLLYLSEDKYLRVLSPVRLYMHARHRIADTLLSRLVESYCDLVDFRSDRFTEEVQYAKLLISPELGNIAFVLRHCMTRGSLPLEQSLLAVNSFSRLCRDLSYYDTALLSEAIAHAGHTVPAIVAQLEQSKAECLYFQDRKDQALIVFMNARELYRSIHDRKGEAECLQRLGDTYLFHHRRTEAMHALLVALSLWSGTDGRRGQARTLRSLGRLYGSLGKANESERALKSALEVFEDIRDDLGKASAFETLGDLFLSLGRFEEAKNMLTSALALYSEINYRLGEDNALQQLGRLYLRVQKLDEGESVLRAALEIYRAVGGRMGEAKSLVALGFLYNQQQRYQDALTVLRPACEIASNISYIAGEGAAWSYLGRAHKQNGHLNDAERCLSEAMRLFEKAGTPYNIEVARRDLMDLRTQRTDRQAP